MAIMGSMAGCVGGTGSMGGLRGWTPVIPPHKAWLASKPAGLVIGVEMWKFVRASRKAWSDAEVLGGVVDTLGNYGYAA